MAKVNDRIAAVLSADVMDRADWDEPPQLWRIYVADQAAPRPVLRPVLVPLELWEGGTADALWFLADQMAGSGLVDPQLYGMAIRHEAWELDNPMPSSPHTSRRVRAIAEAHGIHAHPDRIEVRVAVGVDRFGVTYQVRLARGEAAPERQVLYPDAPDKRCLSGAIPEALDRMITVVTGVQLAERWYPAPGEMRPPWEGG